MKYLKKFSTESQYNSAKASLELPNTSITSDNGHVHANPERGLYFQFQNTGSVTMTIPAQVTASMLEYVEWSVNSGKTWNKVVNTSSQVSFTTTGAKEAWIRAKGTTLSDGTYNTTIGANAACIVGGNIMSLLYGNTNYNEQTTLPNASYTFRGLFTNNARITDASLLILPAASLKEGCYSYMFYGCTGLQKPPKLPATTLAASCYSYMFYGCTGLVYYTALPVTAVQPYCYERMFQGCTSLRMAPKLPATTLATSCYSYMFYGCTGLQVAPKLPATTLAASCYSYMFYGCTSLTDAPLLPSKTMQANCYQEMLRGCSKITHSTPLPATTLAVSCYQGMFYGCTSMTDMPALPATTLQENCYNSMFYGCNKAKNAPKLPATTLVTGCYVSMFQGCSLVDHISAAFTTTPENTYTQNWTYGVAYNGTFTKSLNASWSVTGTNGVPSQWTLTDVNPLCMTAAGSGNISFTIPAGVTGAVINSVAYTKDGWNWISMKNTGKGCTLTATGISSGMKVWWKADAKATSAMPSDFNMSAKFSTGMNVVLSGNIYSMIGDYTDVRTTLANTDTSLAWMFYNCTRITSAASMTIEASVLTPACYEGLFYGCTYLTDAPTLPATTLKPYCYSRMFQGCTRLASAPTLPATTLAEGCYSSMFESCTTMTSVPSLPATTVKANAYMRMFAGCTGLTGTVTLPATTLQNSCYSSMLQGCNKITSVIIGATAFADLCCYRMMYGCTLLSNIQCSSLTHHDGNYTSEWVYGVASSGTYLKAAEFKHPQRGTSFIPANWTIEDIS